MAYQRGYEPQYAQYSSQPLAQTSSALSSSAAAASAPSQPGGPSRSSPSRPMRLDLQQQQQQSHDTQYQARQFQQQSYPSQAQDGYLHPRDDQYQQQQPPQRPQQQQQQALQGQGPQYDQRPVEISSHPSTRHPYTQFNPSPAPPSPYGRIDPYISHSPTVQTPTAEYPLAHEALSVPYQDPASVASRHALVGPPPQAGNGPLADRPLDWENLNDEQRRIAATFPKDLDTEGHTMKDSFKNTLRSWRNWIKWRYWYYYLAILLIAVLITLFAVFHERIITWLTPISKKVNSVDWGWVIPVAIIFVISFPPLFGHEIVGILCGIVYPFWIAFGVVSLGTLLGEIGNFFAFTCCLKRQAAKYETKSLNYACMAHIVREGGFFVVLVARLSAIPGHFTTTVFAMVGMNFFVFTLAAVLSLPKQLVVVYIGKAIADSGTGTESTKSKIIKWAVVCISGIITIAAAWYLYRKMEQARPLVQARLKQRRYTMLSEAASVRGMLANIGVGDSPDESEAGGLSRSRTKNSEGYVTHTVQKSLSEGFDPDETMLSGGEHAGSQYKPSQVVDYSNGGTYPPLTPSNGDGLVVGPNVAQRKSSRRLQDVQQQQGQGVSPIPSPNKRRSWRPWSQSFRQPQSQPTQPQASFDADGTLQAPKENGYAMRSQEALIASRDLGMRDYNSQPQYATERANGDLSDQWTSAAHQEEAQPAQLTAEELSPQRSLQSQGHVPVEPLDMAILLAATTKKTPPRAPVMGNANGSPARRPQGEDMYSPSRSQMTVQGQTEGQQGYEYASGYGYPQQHDSSPSRPHGRVQPLHPTGEGTRYGF